MDSGLKINPESNFQLSLKLENYYLPYLIRIIYSSFFSIIKNDTNFTSIIEHKLLKYPINS